MYISKLSIRNYRNFLNVSLSFQKGVNTIIGENGSGKTNLLTHIAGRALLQKIFLLEINELQIRLIFFAGVRFSTC